MRELKVQITGVEPASRGLTPLLHFKLHISAEPATDPIQALLLNAQVQLECPQRSYTPQEKEKLVELFGEPERWGQTLRNRLWTHANTTVGAFQGSTQAVLPVQCTYDLNIATARYFYALEAGEVPLLFLFAGSVFYATPEGRLQIEPISWNTECAYRLPVQVWQDLMEKNYPKRDEAGGGPAYQIVPELLVGEQLFQTWHEAVEREVRLTLRTSASGEVALDAGPVQKTFSFPHCQTTEPIRDPQQHLAGVMVRRQEAVSGLVELSITPLAGCLCRVTVRVLNQTPVPEAELQDPEAILMRTFASTHTILRVRQGEFVSQTAPPAEYQQAADACQNLGTWPVAQAPWRHAPGCHQRCPGSAQAGPGAGHRVRRLLRCQHRRSSPTTRSATRSINAIPGTRRPFPSRRSATSTPITPGSCPRAG